MDPIRVGKSRNHRERKNGAAHEAWLRLKTDRNKNKVTVHTSRPWPLNGREGYQAC